MKGGENWGRPIMSDHVFKMIFTCPDAPTYNVQYLEGVERNRLSGKFKSPGCRYQLEQVSLINMHVRKNSVKMRNFTIR